MKLTDALRLKPGDTVFIPHISQGVPNTPRTVERLETDDDPRVKLLVRIEGQEDPFNYRLLRKTA